MPPWRLVVASTMATDMVSHKLARPRPKTRKRKSRVEISRSPYVRIAPTFPELQTYTRDEPYCSSEWTNPRTRRKLTRDVDRLQWSNAIDPAMYKNLIWRSMEGVQSCGFRSDYIHMNLICDASFYFKAEFTSRFREVPKKKMDLPEEDRDLFNLLYSDSIVNTNVNDRSSRMTGLRE